MEIARFAYDDGETALPVIPYNPFFPRHIIPPYLIPRVYLSQLMEDENCLPNDDQITVKIYDFGRGKAFAYDTP